MPNNNNTLKDEELKNVNGGGGGNIPSEGLTYSQYTTPAICHYYAADQSISDIVYITSINNNKVYYNIEHFILTNTTWASVAKDDYHLDIEPFKICYPYELNITY